MFIVTTRNTSTYSSIHQLTVHHAFGCTTETYCQALPAQNFSSKFEFCCQTLWGWSNYHKSTFLHSKITTKIDNMGSNTIISQLDVKSFHNYNNSIGTIPFFIVPTTIDTKRLKFFLHHQHIQLLWRCCFIS